ncbi:MAG: PAC2 family protein [Aquiluna sp.]|jgi:predicted ATP-grasp superfamily ATP-dependent carboligase|uniref:proteasome assembly chaperone family protein n=1 Tax=Aquiluna sp. TaxID=2053504 RepID=UPI002749E601|nr:PAC2 family protein [Aquiluna sp.]MDP4887088.1 PAC2 family protein [Aquiluna sp.]
MSKLYKMYGDIEAIKGLPMVAMLSGFTDSGSTIGQISEHFFANLDNDIVLRFDNDELLDYRSRRPVLYFEKDHIESYEPQTLAIYKVLDEADQPFLLLEGYEPDMRWEAFAQSIVELTKLLEVKSFTWVHAIPFPIPHTRPVGVTVSGNRNDMIERFSEWKPQTQVPGNVIHLLEFRLTEQGLPIAGFVLLVPHYLADNEVPKAALAGIEMITAATGLVFPTDQLREEASKFDSKVETQVSENAELAKLVQTLEQGYATGESGPSRAPIGKPTASPPTADELAEELEQYLTTMRKRKTEE